MVNLATQRARSGYAAAAARRVAAQRPAAHDGVANVVEAARAAGVRRVVQESVSFLYADQGDELDHRAEPGRDHPDDRAGCGRGVPRAGLRLRARGSGSCCGSARSSATTARPGYWLGPPPTAGRSASADPAEWAHVIHTDDLGSAVLAALHAPSGVYNVGAEPVLRRELVQGYAEAVGPSRARSWARCCAGSSDRGSSRWRRSLRVSCDHFAAQTGWRRESAHVRPGWLDGGRAADRGRSMTDERTARDEPRGSAGSRARRRRLAEVFGDVLPEQTSDDADESDEGADGDRGEGAEDWLQDDRCRPHHG